jgi:hypothetical protein
VQVLPEVHCISAVLLDTAQEQSQTWASPDLLLEQEAQEAQEEMVVTEVTPQQVQQQEVQVVRR